MPSLSPTAKWWPNGWNWIQRTPLLVSATALASPEEERENDNFLYKGYRPGALLKSFKQLVSDSV